MSRKNHLNNFHKINIIQRICSSDPLLLLLFLQYLDFEEKKTQEPAAKRMLHANNREIFHSHICIDQRKFHKTMEIYANDTMKMLYTRTSNRM